MAPPPSGAPPSPRLTLGVLANELQHFYQATLLNAILASARQHAFNVLCFPGGRLHATAYFENQRNMLYDLATPQTLDGVIILSGALQASAARADIQAFFQRYHPLPCLSLGLTLADYPSLGVDNAYGIVQAVQHLVHAHQCRRIAFVRGPEHNEEAQVRYAAYQQALTECDLPVNPDLVVAGDFNQLSGQAAVRELLDQRHQTPDAILAACDEMALGVLKALQARGLDVPGRLAVVGFDDSEESQAITPPLTTIHQPIYELGWRAAELMWSLWKGEPVPPLTTLPTRLVVRETCGCFSPAPLHNLVDDLPAPSLTPEPLGTVLAARRQALLTDLVQAAGSPPYEMPTPPALAAILDAFIDDLLDQHPDSFLPALNRVLRQAAVTHSQMPAWHRVISTLRRQVLPYLPDRARLIHAENLWHQARLLIAQSALHSHIYRQLQAGRQAEVLRQVGEILGTTYSLQHLAEVILQFLPELGLTEGYLALYQSPAAPTGGARLIAAYTPQLQLRADNGRHFPARQLAPPEIFVHTQPYAFVIEPLYFRDEQLGFMLLTLEVPDWSVYETLRSQISSALKTIQLLAETRQTTQLTQALYDTGRALASALNEETILRILLQTLHQTFACEYLLAVLVNPALQVIESRHGIWLGQYGSFPEWAPATGSPLEHTDLLADIYRTGRTEVVDHWDERFNREAWDRCGQAHRLRLYLPVKNRQHTFGVIELGFDKSCQPQLTPTELQTLAAFVDQAAAALGTAQLLHELRQTAFALAQERNLLRTVIDNLPHTIYVKDLASRFVIANRYTAHLMGAPLPADLLGKSDADFYPAELAESYRAKEQVVLETGQPLLDFEEPVLASDGQRLWFATTKIPLRDAAGQVSGLVGIGQDITERKLAEEQIRQFNEELERRVQERTAQLEAANQELEAFSYSVSHDLRAPLRAMDGFSRILLEEYQPHLPADAQRYLNLVRTNAQQMGVLIDNLLTFSRLNRQPIKKQRLPPATLARQALETLGTEQANRQIEIRIGDLPDCLADPVLLRQVFANLLSNALKFTRLREQACIEVDCQPGAEPVYFVKDNGVGFEMRYASKIFGVFQRLHRADEYEGTGVGLAIVQRILHRHGGRIWVESAVDTGTTFYFTLPSQ